MKEIIFQQIGVSCVARNFRDSNPSQVECIINRNE